jgi:hypothetical protein
MRDNRMFVNNNQMYTEPYVQDTNVYNVDTGKSADYIQVGTLDDYVDFGEIRVQNAVNIDYQTPLSGNEKTEYIHGDLFQQRNLPYYTSASNLKGEQTGNVTYIHEIKTSKETN